MKQFGFRYAGIIFTVAIHKNDFSKPYLDHFRAYPAPDPAGIKIEALIEPREHIINNAEVDKPPDCTINNDILNIVHPYYEGTYNLTQNEGNVSVSSLFALMAFIRLIVSVVIIGRGGLAIHSSCIFKNNRAYIFSGSSGYGKSTIVKLTDKPLLYSDEVTLVRKDESGIFNVYHSPFRSEFNTEALNATEKIAGTFFLRQDSRVYLEPLSQTQALIKLLPNVFFPVVERNPFEQKIFKICLEFLSQVRAVVLHFKKDDSFWRCIDDEFSNLGTESRCDYQNN